MKSSVCNGFCHVGKYDILELLCVIWCHYEAGDSTLRGGKGFEVKLNERNVDEDDQTSLYFGLVLSFDSEIANHLRYIEQ